VVQAELFTAVQARWIVQGTPANQRTQPA
jgi:hypothetical protein